MKFRSVISLTLMLMVVLAGVPVSAAEFEVAAPSLGEFSGSGDVQVRGNPADSGHLFSGDHIRIGDSASASLLLSNGNKIELSRGAEVFLSSTEQDVRLQMTAGSMAFDASNNRIAIAIGPNEISPAESSTGSVVFVDGSQAVLKVLTGSVKFHDSDGQTDVVVSGGSERIVSLAPPTQIASNIAPLPTGALSQDPAQAPPGQRPGNLPATDPEQQPPATRPGNLPTDPSQQPPAQRPANLPTTDSGQSPTVTKAKSGSKLPIYLGVGGGAAAAAILLAAKGNSSGSSGNETPPPCSPTPCPQTPVISTLLPNQGSVGSTITISGANFGATQGTSTVTFNGIAAVINSWSTGSILAVVPGGATSGNVVVSTSAGSSNGMAFTVNPSPTITSLTPNSGAVGSSVTIAGANFGASQGTSTVTFNGTVATTIATWSSTSIVAVVPAGAGTGNVVVTTTAGGPSNGLPFTVIGAPVLTTLSPTSGLVGSAVTIAGSNFGAAQGSSTVKFNGIAAAVSSWSNTSIVATVPAGATTGNVVVTTVAGSSNGLPFTVIAAPVLSTLTPNSGPVGTAVTIAGSNFGATQGTSTVKFNGIAASVSSWSNTSIMATVPAGATTGNVVVTTVAGDSNGVAFTVTVAPFIASLTPNSGPVGTAVSIAGSNFGATQGTSTVKFNGITAAVSNWSNTSIAATVPAGATTGNVVVTTVAGASNGVTFTVTTPPSIVSLTPNSGPVGSAVSIAGSNFGATQGSSTVKFNGIAAAVSSWGNTSIVATVPAGATTGNVVVTTAAGDSNGVAFTVNPSPSIASLTPNSGPAGSGVTIAGSNFGGVQGSSTVTFNGTTATSISSWSDTSINVLVPAGATTGNVVVTTPAGGSSNGVAFTVITGPVITNLFPDAYPNGSAITIQGTGFGNAQGTSSVTFNGVTAQFFGPWSDTSIVVEVPSSATSGNIVVTTSVGPSNGAFFTVTTVPVITNLSPDNGPEGSTVTITGTSFGGVQGGSAVTFNGTTAQSISSWTNTSIVTLVPAGATTGDVVVTTVRGPSNGVPFTVDSSGMSVSMSVDHSVASPGDPVVFSFSASNPGDTPLSVASLNNTLPPGFAFTTGSATIHIIGANGEETDARSITPVVNSDNLVFSIGSLAAGAKVLIRYSAVVRSDARPGEHRSGVVGIANVLSGKRVNSSPSQVRVVVTQGAFTLNQILIGRVFEDRNRNGSYDSGETGVANVRVVTSSGQTATTDSDGLYSLPSLSAGSVLVAIDPSTLPPGFSLPPNESRLGGAGQLLRTPLEGGGLLRQNFALVRSAISIPTTTDASSFTEHSDAGDGDKEARLHFIIDRPVMAAGGYDRQLIRIRVSDNREHADDAPILVSTSTGAVMAASRTSNPDACESVLSLDPRPDLSRQVSVEVEDGEAVVCLVSDVVPSTTHLTASSSGRRALNTTADVRFESSQHPPLLVAAGEMGIGLSGPGKNATDGARRVDGLVSVFYQQSLTKKDLLSVAVRSKGSVNSASGNNGLFEFDPTQRIYPVMGDASTRQELGQSASRVYARYDRGQSYVMYGDLHGDIASEGRSGLLEYNRNVTGFRVRIQTSDPANWLQAQVARPKTGYMREISSVPGSAIRLSRPQITPGSETITLEVRDRRNPELILSRETLVRNIDYSLDPASGIVFMMRSISLFDPSLNLVQLVSTYEYQTTGTNSATYLGRGSYQVSPIGLRLGVSMLSQNEGGTNFSIGGLELEQKLWNGGRFHAELPISNGKLQTDVSDSPIANRNGMAIRAELEQPLGLRNTILHGRYARTDEGFFNPYGATTVQGVQSRGASVETRGFGNSRLSFGIEQEVNRNSAVDNQRQTISAKLTETLTENLSLETEIDRRAFEDHSSGQQIDSELISVGLKWKPLSRLETSIRREQNLGEADPTYPSQTLLGAQYKLSASSRLFATQRFSSAPITPIGGAETIGVLSPRSTRETAIGVESRLLGNTNLTTNYRMDTSETGADSFAVLGVLTRVPVRPGLSFDWTLDNAVHLAGAGKGYVGGSFGFTKSKDDQLRMFTRYEMRRSETTQGIFTAGIVGRLSTATSAMARYRVANNTAGTVGRTNDGQVALAVRPKKSDRVALLFSYDFGNGNATTSSASTTNGLISTGGTTVPVSLANPGRTDRLSADSLIQIAHGFEFYSRVAEARTSGLYGGSRLGTYLQGRLQKSLTHRFDIAGEARWIRESVIVRGSLITGVEWGTWITRDFRIGLGYSSRGFANPGSLLNSTAARGGPYLIVSSKLSSIFDLMGGSGKTN